MIRRQRRPDSVIMDTSLHDYPSPNYFLTSFAQQRTEKHTEVVCGRKVHQRAVLTKTKC